MDNKWNNINKRKETLNSDGQQVEQYKYKKRNVKQRWSTSGTI